MFLFLSNALGNRVISQQLRDACAAAKLGVEGEFSLDVSVYERLVRSPRRYLGSMETAIQCAELSLVGQHIPRGAVVLANGWELALAAAARPEVARVILAADMFPDATLLAQCGWLTEGRFLAAMRRLSVRVNQRRFKAVATKFVSFLPLTTIAQNAFARTFGERALLWPPTLCPQRGFADSATRRRAPNEPPLILFVGNDLVRKGIALFLQTVEVLRRKQEIEARVVTNDPNSAKLLRAHPVEVVRGIHEAQELREHYREADLLLFPTRRDALGLVAGEALAAGTPVIASDVGGLRDLVSHHGAGVLVSRHAPATEYARACEHLLSSKERMHETRVRALAWARANLEWNKFVSVVESAVKVALA